ncbi:hypothetical protein EST38_g9220 [Candolleomyces aberdarensis]|uniref:Uncharacterized protein n=1 Tax=Candolleomyces aberdarensis TaxID=2316362 RepID=A0A4Q2DDE2_9AGAR|nr:hypothetical protein EST38_g9220 [Candolleomyces aberdarensis]
MDEWPQKDLYHIRRYASIYRSAQSERDQQAIFDACGWRWSPLFELDYWNPTLFTVIDSMHSLDLNLLKNHVRELLQINFKHKSGGALREPSTTRIKRVTSNKDDIRSLKRCQQIIFDNEPHLLYDLLKFHRKILYSFCLDYDIRMDGHKIVVGTRWLLAKTIFLWRYPSLSILQEELLQGIRETEDANCETLDVETSPIPPATGGPSSSQQALPQDDQPNDDSVAAPDGGSTAAPQALPDQVVLHRFAKRLVGLLGEDESDTDPSQRLYSQISARVLAALCDILSLDRTAISLDARAAKKALFSLLMTELRSNAAAPQSLLNHFSDDTDEARPNANAFLGSDVMAAVYDDMARTRLPSWITPAPRDWGTIRRGKLSADNWRIVCCIHLPITLIRLFGASDGHPRALLDNFMDLITAVRIATMRSSSAPHVETYNKYILKYTKSALELFPDYNILPSHHAALHIGAMLARFGPKHAHDSPHYERYINFFHHMNTNNHIGEVEGTFLRTAVRHANLLALLDDSQDMRALVRRMLSRMEGHQREALRGFRLTQALDPFNKDDDSSSQHVLEGADGELTSQETELLADLLRRSPQERNTIVLPNVTFLTAISYKSNVYAIWDSQRYRDSAILYQHEGEEQAGVIQKIFVHQHRSSSGEEKMSRYLLLAEYQHTDRDLDRFRRYGHAGGFTCRGSPQTVRLIPLESVICHVAVTDFAEEGLLHVLPINRTLFSFENFPSVQLQD